jgi:cytochrome c553
LIAAWLPFTAQSAPITEREFEVVLRSTADVAHGHTLYATCAACHGSNGSGVSDGSVPAIAAQHFRVVARELVDYRHDKRWDLRMAHFTDDHHLNDAQEIADIAAYISTLPATRTSSTGTGQSLQHGAEAYASRCASCHGPAAEGDDRKGYPRLAGQHYPYLLRQMHDAVAGQRPNFPRDHLRVLKGLDQATVAGVADHLSRLGP